MYTFPDIKPTKAVFSLVKPAYRSEFEAGYVQTRPKYTRPRYRIQLIFDILTETEKQQIEDFFKENQGSSFIWHDGETNTDYTVIFADDNLDFKHDYPKYYSVTINLEEM